MDNIEITVFDEITDYKEKIYFFNFRQWLFTILIGSIVIPTYLILKDKIGDEITSYIVIAIAGILGFIGFVKIHELPAEKILPYWFRHYFLFAKPIVYMTDAEFEIQKQQKKHRESKAKNQIKSKNMTKVKRKELKKSMAQTKVKKDSSKIVTKTENVENRKETREDENTKEYEDINSQKEDTKEEIKDEITTEKAVELPTEKNTIDENELVEQLSKLTTEQKEALIKLLER